MNKGFVVAIFAVAMASAGIGWWYGRATAPQESAVPLTAPPKSAQPEILYYRNPMGLPDTSPVPKKDSMGMDYVPVYAGEAPSTPGTVVLSPEKVQMTGVRTVKAELVPMQQTLRASGSIAIDSARQWVIAPKFEGWVQTLAANQVGMRVRRGQALMSVYSPELRSAQNEYLIAQRAAATMAAADPASAASMRDLSGATLERLRNWGIGGGSLERLKGGQVDQFLTLTAPADAVITDKPAVQGMRFMAGEMLLTLADLSRVWLVANVPASDSAQLALGQNVQFRSSALPGRSFEGTVSFIAPTFDEASRTLTVRVELDNAEGALRPGLFGDVEFQADAGAPVLTVPRSAVLDSGTRQVVFVELAAGRYEPRKVALGRRSGDRVEITDGLVEGESVVSAANFLIDAESNLGSALEGMAPEAEEAGQGAIDEAGHGARGTGHEEERGASDEPAEATPVGAGLPRELLPSDQGTSLPQKPKDRGVNPLPQEPKDRGVNPLPQQQGQKQKQD
ncbi:MAG TPA: efflux RND transporter periplasmic adaptor subunit, partial [Xanthomonadales bacterium]|nr:efflux RND transporter periplasmic adaptor subunit [Xanthomonadales bacterium]